MAMKRGHQRSLLLAKKTERDRDRERDRERETHTQIDRDNETSEFIDWEVTFGDLIVRLIILTLISSLIVDTIVIISIVIIIILIILSPIISRIVVSIISCIVVLSLEDRPLCSNAHRFWIAFLDRGTPPLLRSEGLSTDREDIV
jgi:hypothetical protein